MQGMHFKFNTKSILSTLFTFSRMQILKFIKGIQIVSAHYFRDTSNGIHLTIIFLFQVPVFISCNIINIECIKPLLILNCFRSINMKQYRHLLNTYNMYHNLCK